MSLNEWIEEYNPILSTNPSLISTNYDDDYDFLFFKNKCDEKKLLKRKEEIDRLMEHFNDEFFIKYVMDYDQAWRYPIQHKCLVETFPHFLNPTNFFVVTRKSNDFSNLFIVSSDGNYKIKLFAWERET